MKYQLIGGISSEFDGLRVFEGIKGKINGFEDQW